MYVPILRVRYCVGWAIFAIPKTEYDANRRWAE
jgi:hypothetical protein